jgi:hypothetical protein
VPGSLPKDPGPETCQAAPMLSVCALDSVIPILCSKAYIKWKKALTQEILNVGSTVTVRKHMVNFLSIGMRY